MGKRGSGAGAGGAGPKAAQITPTKKSRPSLPPWVSDLLDSIKDESMECPFTEVCKRFGPPAGGPTFHQGLAEAVDKYLADQGSEKVMISAGMFKFPLTRPEDGVGSKLCYKIQRSIYTSLVFTSEGNA
jgi:hypothetical protein